MTVIELLFFILAVATGVVTATYASSTWGIWGGFGGFIVGALSFVGVVELIARILPPKRRLRCTCGKCGVDDFVFAGEIDGYPIRAYACGRKYLVRDAGLELLTKPPEGEAGPPPEGKGHK